MNLRNKLPIYTDRLKISILNKQDISWYSSELIKPYFYEYLDNKNIKDMSIDEIKVRLGYLISKYRQIPLDYNLEVRLVVKNKVDNTRYGGLTIFPINNNMITVAYWVSPVHQSKGIATEALNGLIDFIYKIYPDIVIRLEIQSCNLRSIGLANRCGFSLYDTISGKYCDNFIYTLYR